MGYSRLLAIALLVASFWAEAQSDSLVRAAVFDESGQQSEPVFLGLTVHRVANKQSTQVALSLHPQA